MNDFCQIPNIITKLRGGSSCQVAYIGGSVTLSTGASNTAETSWRALFQKYLYREFHRKYYCRVTEIFSGLGACPSCVASFMVSRNLLPADPTLTFVEFCLNDRHVQDKALAEKGMEGIIRQLLFANNPSDIIILGAGCNPDGTTPDRQSGPVDHTLHRKIAEYYNLPFFDLQAYTYKTLQAQGLTWKDIMDTIDNDENYHLNDLGQQIYFDAIRTKFEEQLARYDPGRRKNSAASIVAPLFSDELQFVRLIDPSRKNRGLSLEGDWKKKPVELVPWYCDNVMMGKPGAKLSFTFDGTAVMLWGIMHHNGLKMEAVLDGNEIYGPYLKYTTEFGKGFMLAHGLPEGEHHLELTVGPPSRRHNKLENPRAQIGYLGVASTSHNIA